MRLNTLLKILILLIAVPAISQSQTLNDVVQLISKGDIQKAKIQIQKMNLAEDESLYIRGLLSTDADSADICYQILLTKCTTSHLCDDALFRLGQKQYMGGLYHSSLIYFNRIRQNHSKSSLISKSYYWTGLCHKAMNQPDSSKYYFEKSLLLSKSDNMQNILKAELKDNKPSQNQNTSSSTSQQTYYAIQVGAFSNQNNANMRKAYFQREGFKIRIKTKSQQGKRLHLVWLGEFKTRPEAMAMSETIKMKYGVKCHLVSETVQN